MQPLHHRAIALLLAGHSDAAVAKALSIDRTTIYRWRKCNPHFLAELNRLRQDNWQAGLQRLRTLFARATAILARCMRSKDPAQQLKAAQILLSHAAAKTLAPDPAPTAPEEIIELIARKRRARKQDAKRPSPSERKDVADLLAYVLQTDSDDLAPE